MLGLQELLQELEAHQLEEDLVEVVVDVVAPSLVVDAQEGFFAQWCKLSLPVTLEGEGIALRCSGYCL